MTTPTQQTMIDLLTPIADQDWHGKWRIKRALEILNTDSPVSGECLPNNKLDMDVPSSSANYEPGIVGLGNERIRQDQQREIRLLRSKGGNWVDNEGNVWLQSEFYEKGLAKPYLPNALKPVLNKPDAAMALSKAILEAHAKWKEQYQGVGHDN